TVGADRDDRRMVGGQTAGLELGHDEMLQRQLAARLWLSQPATDFTKCRIHSLANRLRGALVTAVLRRRPYRLGALDEIVGRAALDPNAADELDRAGINPGDVRHRVGGRVLHRHQSVADEQLPESRMQLLPRAIDAGGPG